MRGTTRAGFRVIPAAALRPLPPIREQRQQLVEIAENVAEIGPAFFAKSWPQYELDGLVTMAVSGKQVILPLWHEISKDEVIRHSPSLADKVALRTSDYAISEIADELAAVVLAA